MLKLNGRKAKAAGFIGTVALTGGLLASAVVGTGAYFSDTQANNHITGTMGSIQIEGHDGSGDNSLDVVFTNMLPGETHSKTLRYSNTGANDQDVWIVFKDATKLHALNQLGTYGEVHVASNGTERFASQNLNDGYPCGTDGGTKDGVEIPDLCALPGKIKLAEALQPGHTGDFTFSFKPGAAFKNVQSLPMLDLDYDLVATQVGVTP